MSTSLVKAFIALPASEQVTALIACLRACSVRNSRAIMRFSCAQGEQRVAVEAALADMRTVDYISALPLDLAVIVLSHLDAKSICRAYSVSKHWNKVVNYGLIALRTFVVVVVVGAFILHSSFFFFTTTR